MSVAITKHIIKRYVERIKDIKDELERNRYISLHEDEIIDKIEKLYHRSKWIYKGQVGADKATANFYLYEDTIIVADVNESKLFTLYKIDFDFPPTTTKIVIEDLFNSICNLRTEFDKCQKEIDDFVSQKQFIVDSCDLEIRNLKDQIELLDEKKRNAKDDIVTKRKDTQYVQKKIESYANRLCNSQEFRKDIVDIVKMS